jgi:hypothetical protein
LIRRKRRRQGANGKASAGAAAFHAAAAKGAPGLRRAGPKRRGWSDADEGIFGTEIRVNRGEVEVDDDALIPDDPDDARSMTRRGRRARLVWAPDELLRRQQIDQAQHDAAVRYADDYEVGVLGARPKDARAHLVRVDDGASPPWNRVLYSQRRAMARQSFEFARRALAGKRLRPGAETTMTLVLQACVLERRSLRAFAAIEHVGHNRASDLLKQGLQALAEHYGYAGQASSIPPVPPPPSGPIAA